MPTDRADVLAESVRALVKGHCPMDGTQITWNSEVLEFAKVRAEAGLG